MAILIIQTAFLGDAVLATSLLESLHSASPTTPLDVCVRKGNEALFLNHPFIREVLVFDKKKSRIPTLWRLGLYIRSKKYDRVINLQRFASSGFLSWISGAKDRRGFDKNPLSFLFTQKFPHIISALEKKNAHEIYRNHTLIQDFVGDKISMPKLYPQSEHFKKAELISEHKNYVCIAPASVWFTKQYPREKWMELIASLPNKTQVFLLGGKTDKELCGSLEKQANTSGFNVKDLSGTFSYLETAALMKGASMNYVNDSAPLHFASAMNAPVMAIYCSTIPAFGFGPLSENSKVIEVREVLTCRPCGLHGRKSCPEGHFKCALNIKTSDLL